VAVAELQVEEHPTDLDSHADTCVVGKHALIVHMLDKKVNVTGFDPTQGKMKDLDLVSAALAYDCPISGEAIILMIHQAVHVPTMENDLLCPMQMRMNDVEVHECPKFMEEAPSDTSHTLCVTQNGEDLCIPFGLRGVTSYFPTRKPTTLELAQCRRFDLTAEDPKWDPSSTTFQDQENAQVDSHGMVHDTGDERKNRRFISSVSRSQACDFVNRNSQCSAVLTDINPNLHEDYFVESLVRNVKVASTMTGKRKSVMTAQRLSKNWCIPLASAEQTLKVTTQQGVRTVANPSLSRRFRTNDRQLRYRRLRCDMYTDGLDAKTVPSLRGNKHAQIYATRFGWFRAHPMKAKSETHETVSVLFARDGVPNVMVMDGAKEQTQGEFRRKCREAGCHIRQTEPYSPWMNMAENGVRELKKASARAMLKAHSPKRLWDDCLELQAFIKSHTAGYTFGLNGETPETMLTGETADISEFAEFGWYDWVKFRDTVVPYPQDKLVLGRYLGPSTDIGPAMTAKILKANGQYVHRSTLRGLTDDEVQNPDELKLRNLFDEEITQRLGPKATQDDFDNNPDIETANPDLYEDAVQAESFAQDREDIPDNAYDTYIGAELVLQKGDAVTAATVKRRKLDEFGNATGKANTNPILDTRQYILEFADGAEAEYSANVIAENMWAQCDDDGYQYRLMEAIVDHKFDEDAVKRADGFVVVNGRKHRKKCTKGVQLCIQWKDGSTSWERLADVKESNPIEVAEYSVARGINDEPAFAWWVDFTLKKRARIIAAVKKRVIKKTHKFGIRVPNNVNEAHALDKENGNTLWGDAIAKEMTNVRVAFDIKEKDTTPPVGYQEIRCHGIFDVKMDGFARKYRMVAGGHTTEAPKTLTYASVVSRESVRIVLTMAALNDLEVKAADIQNAYLTAPVSEKIWTRLGPEFGEDAGKVALIVRALYGLKSAGASFRNHLADYMRELGYESCKADADVWLKAETRPDGFKYYSYVLCYVDDVLCVHHDSMQILLNIGKRFPLKKGSVGDPDIYLGAKLRKVTLENGVEAWSMSPSKYVQEAVKNVKNYLQEKEPGRPWPKKAPTPFSKDYRPEIDISPELGVDDATYYMSQIGILRWMVELGRVDIITEVSMLASQLACPREGHLEAVFRIYAYLDNKHNSRMVFDPTYAEIDMSSFKQCDWKEFYGEVSEPLPPNMPEPRGKEIEIRLYVDSDHAGDQLVRRSRTGYFVFLNMAPLIWFSKRQPTVETSVFGAEFVALKNGMETVRGLRYKLRMMGIPIEGPTFAYGDNMSVIHNTQRPESMLKKKSNSVCYHYCRESVAMGECMTGHVPTKLNPADLCTKVIPGGAQRDYLVTRILYDITTT
jgi:hypothetical protein